MIAWTAARGMDNEGSVLIISTIITAASISYAVHCMTYSNKDNIRRHAIDDAPYSKHIQSMVVKLIHSSLG